MSTYWRIEEITERPGVILAELRRVEFFKRNPEREALDAEYDAYAAEHTDEEANVRYLDVPWPDEFIDAEPEDEGADSIEGPGPKIVLDITDGPELHPLDVVVLSIAVRVGVTAAS